jgi:hypothetical protein
MLNEMESMREHIKASGGENMLMEALLGRQRCYLCGRDTLNKRKVSTRKRGEYYTSICSICSAQMKQDKEENQPKPLPPPICPPVTTKWNIDKDGEAHLICEPSKI